MKLPILALFERNLRQETRSAGMHFGRMGFLFLILLTLSFNHIISLFSDQPCGRTFFLSLVWVDFVAIALAGCPYFAAVVAEEKEEMTLGLLRMTGLSPLAVLLGKSGARLLGALQFLAVQIPFVLLAITLGGLSSGQIWAAYACLGAFLILVAGAGALFSVLMSTPLRAATATVVFFVVVLAAPAIAAIMLGAAPGPGEPWLLRAYAWAVTRAGQASPITRLIEISDVAFAGGSLGFQVYANLGLACLLFGLAWLLFDVFADARRMAGERGLFDFLRRTEDRPPRPVWGLPLAWKDFRFLVGGWWHVLVESLLLAAGFGVLLAACVYLEHWSGNNRALYDAGFLEKVGMVWLWLVFGLGCVRLLILLGEVFNREWREGTWPAVAGTPLPLGRIAAEKLAGVSLTLVPYVAAFAAGAVLAFDPLCEFLHVVLKDAPLWMVAVVFYGIAFLTFAVFMSLVLKRGGVLVAFLGWFVGGYTLANVFIMLAMLVLMPFGMSGSLDSHLFEQLMKWLAPLVLAVLFLGAAWLFVWLIGARLRRIAGEG